jgi:hypothetical protein
MTAATKPRREAVPRTSEAEVVRRVMEYLSLKDIPAYRINSGAAHTASGGFVRFGAKGMSDIYAIGPGGRSVWIECKRPKGGVVSPYQREFIDRVNRHGGVAIIVTSLESLEIQLKEAGVI